MICMGNSSDGLTRRQLISILPMASAGAMLSSVASSSRRNVLLLIADDLGLDIHPYGNRVIRTPNLDQLAAEGVVFTNAFAAVSSCSPSRSVILTGLFNHTNGQYGLSHGASGQRTHSWVQSLPKLLGEQGYRTGIIGKNHVSPPEVYPFTWSVVPGVNQRDVFQIAQRARDFFAGDRSRPFFLLVGYGDPHRANRTKGGFANDRQYPGIQKVTYDPRAISVPFFLPNRPEVGQELAEYYQAISRLDQGVGLVMQALEESGQKDETLVIFLSDNGMPFIGAKTNLYDPGIHLPLIIRSPLQQRRQVRNHGLVSWVDITPTILDWTGIQSPHKLPGRSILPILEQSHPRGWDTIFASHSLHWVTQYYPMRAIRTREYKYIWNLAHQLPYPLVDTESSPTWQSIVNRKDRMIGQRSVDAYFHRPEHELYQLKKDAYEVRNIAAKPAYASVLSQLQAQMRQMMQQTKDPWA